jgi:hypothetical protein
MICARQSPRGRGRSESLRTALAVLLIGAAAAESSAAMLEPPAARAAAPLDNGCAREVIPFETLRDSPRQLRLRTSRGVSLRQIHAFRVSRPELFHFRRFDARMAGILSDGCAVDFWWSASAGAYRVEEIRILGPVASLERSYGYLQLPPDPQPSWSPTFEGYRHVMSSEVSSPGLSYIGLWRRSGRAPGSLVVAYNVDRTRVVRLGTANWNYDGVYAQLSFHRGFYGFMLVDEPEGSEPLYMVVYDWIYGRAWPARQGGRS